MILVLFEESAQSDLDAIWESDEEAAATIVVLMEEFQDSPEIAATLIRHGYHDYRDPEYNVSRFQELWHQGLNMYRLKFWDEDGSPVPYRIIYAHNPITDCIHVLGVIHRNFDYDTSHPTVCRICAEYERLGIPSY
ncbi:MAG: hypothetical protein ACXVH6_04440 [Halobacteriota archaeon]